MAQYENFENVKVGDKIFYTTGSGYSFMDCIGTVTKVTAKTFTVGNSHRFKKEDGAEIGHSYRHCRYATEQDFEKRRYERRMSDLRGTVRNFFSYYDKVQMLSEQDLEAICEIIKKYSNE